MLSRSTIRLSKAYKMQVYSGSHKIVSSCSKGKVANLQLQKNSRIGSGTCFLIRASIAMQSNSTWMSICRIWEIVAASSACRPRPPRSSDYRKLWKTRRIRKRQWKGSWQIWKSQLCPSLSNSIWPKQGLNKWLRRSSISVNNRRKNEKKGNGWRRSGTSLWTCSELSDLLPCM